MQKIVIAALTVTLSLVAPTDALACGCGRLMNPTDEQFATEVTKEFNKATVVFSGEVVAKEYKPLDDNSSGEPAGTEVLVIKIAAEGWWKGDIAGEVVLYTRSFRYGDGTGSSYGCDYSFKVGKKYLVYAFGAADELYTHACARTIELEYAERDIKVLEKLKQGEDRN